MYSQLNCGLPDKREGQLCYGNVLFCGFSSSHFSHGDFLLSDTDSIIFHDQFQYILHVDSVLS